MNIYISLNNLNSKKIGYQKPVRNKIKSYTNFYRILYNEPCYTIYNLMINIPLNSIITNTHNNVYRISFTNQLLHYLFMIETDILKNINYITSKRILHNLYNECINKRYIIKANEEIKNITLRISGIWESNENIGLTYKFITNL